MIAGAAETATASAVSPWMSGAPRAATSLQGDVEADVVIVGGGYTGLSTALAMRGRGASVVLLEGQFCGFGASGRNAGHLTPTIGKDLPTLTRLFGRERVRSLVALVELAIDEVERLISTHSIQCHYEAVGNVVAAVHPRQFAAIDRASATARELGLPGTLLDENAMRERGLPAAFVRGYHEQHGGILHPGAYVQGLRQAAVDAGAAIYEASPVLRLEDAARPRAITAAGSARGRALVLATNAYALDLELPAPLRSRLLPIYVQLLQTAPLSAEQLARIGWRGREGIYTAHEILESWRLSHDDRIVGGSKHIRYGYGGGLLPDRDGRVTVKLEGLLRKRFPEIAEVAVDTVWGGRIGLTLDFLPTVGRTGAHRSIYYSMAYAGHGLAMASYAGTMIADLIAGRSGPGQTLWGRRTVPLPPSRCAALSSARSTDSSKPSIAVPIRCSAASPAGSAGSDWKLPLRCRSRR
ncbi:MAG TPA: FAD-binding oxidoreductase [Candidatus Binatia bacterium]|nr:FAD-binding oxidoreductase [Candidatus Binatia bacterium]